MPSEYQPGVCNIGKNEIRKRYSLAVIGFVITAAIVSLVILSNSPRLWLLVSFISLFLGFEGFYQGYFHFCAGFASAGISDFTGSGGSKRKVNNSEFHKKDMQKAMQIHLYSFVSSVILVTIIYLVL